MSGICLMITITERSRVGVFEKLYKEHGVEVSFTSYGHGTAASEVLDSFGLAETEKALMYSVITEESFPALRGDLRRRFHIDIPGTGVVFLVPLSAMGGKKQLSFMLGGQEYIPGEESEMKATDNELIIVIANQGYTESIMDAARSAGVRGGTVLHAKGTGMQGAQKFFGFVIAEEKEMVYMVVSSSTRDQVMRSIMEHSGMRSKAQAVCFSLPVSATAGMRLEDAAKEE